MEKSCKLFGNKRVVAAIRRMDDLPEALYHPNIETIIILGGDINYLSGMIKKARAAGKTFLVHLDLLEGIGKDRAGVHLLARMNLDGIITTKSNLVKCALDEGMLAVQRFFMVDSESLKTAIKVAQNVTPHAVEILPATVPAYVVEELKNALGVPVMAGGLLKTEEDVREALSKGIMAISTSLRKLWNISLN
ncbi:glycerol-3-phosphate responsive antiterminator, GlpP [Desulfofundulus kuznetsovii DSM 6115]|uniref:Glycerol-3-phosphate responsive antiterminator, GlpP n=1 Tax=Desulfofundulus kuznetsovii (strain DSM 6115 / VKM B-1805 / 17) TaxID=760568 RepID=A0AAU8Q204_DESK7|nr:glycerol-3-phosphate responsive antiterminator, GlpP [Desulfofundulus kuznetsovii DSM 6115]